jgi:hypothetical protein
VLTSARCKRTISCATSCSRRDTHNQGLYAPIDDHRILECSGVYLPGALSLAVMGVSALEKDNVQENGEHKGKRG